MQSKDPRWGRFWQNLIWYVLTLIVLIVLLQFLRSPVILAALWIVGIIWGGILAYKLSRLLFTSDNTLTVTQERSKAYMEQAHDYQSKIEAAIDDESTTTGQMKSEELLNRIDDLVEAIDDLVDRISNLRHNEVIRRDLQTVPQAIKDLEIRLAAETDVTIRAQLERTLANRQKQLVSLQALQGTVKRAEIQIESTISQLGTIYSQVLTGQSTSQVADYSRLSGDVDEEVRLLQDHLEALREVKLGEA